MFREPTFREMLDTPLKLQTYVEWMRAYTTFKVFYGDKAASVSLESYSEYDDEGGYDRNISSFDVYDSSGERLKMLLPEQIIDNPNLKKSFEVIYYSSYSTNYRDIKIQQYNESDREVKLNILSSISEQDLYRALPESEDHLDLDKIPELIVVMLMGQKDIQ